MKYQYIPYQRPFKVPLKTHHGVWSVREGIIVILEDEAGKIAQGEIAPLPEFGTETLTDALNFCCQLPPFLSTKIVAKISDRLPCCQFGFESALSSLTGVSNSVDDHKFNYSYLLPTGCHALDTLRSKETQQYLTFKWKIAVQSFEEERSLLRQLMNYLPEQAKIRLDANGGLNLEEAKYWLELTDNFNNIEFIEQPLSTNNFSNLLTLSQQFKTAIALDESVCSLAQLRNCYAEGWGGIYVLKAAIMGYPSRLSEWLAHHPIDAIFSSVMESAIARQQVLNLARQWGNPQRAIGFGVNDWFKNSDLNSDLR